MMDQMSQKEFWAKHASKGLQNMLRTGTVINLVWLFALVLSHLPQYASGGLGAPLLVFVGAGILTAALAGGAYVWKSRACALAVLAGSAGLLVLDAVFFDSFSGGSYFFFFFMGCFMTISAAFAYQRLWQQYKTTGQVPISPSHLTAPPGEKERARNTGTQPVGKLGGSASLYSRSEAAAKEAEAVRSAEFYANLYGQSHYGSQAIANSQAEDSGPRFPSYRFVALLLLWSVAGFTLAFFSGSFAHIFLHTKELHPTIALLRREEAAIYLRLILAVATPALSYLALVAGGVVHSARKRNRADPLSPGPAFARATTSPAALLPSYRSPNYAVGLLAFLLFLQLFFVLALFLVDEPLEDLSLLRADLTLAHAEEWEVLEGKPNAQYRRYQETGYQMEAQDGFYTMTFGKTRLRCPVDLYDGSIALDDSYFALYLPNTRTMTALYDSNRQPVTGQGNGLGRYFLEDGHWLHGSYSVRPAAEVYGYDFLNQAEKQAFDLFYGLYYAQTVIENGGTNSFVLPAALTDEEYARVQALFRTSRSFDAYANFRYDTDSRNSISKVYAGGISGSVDGKASGIFRQGMIFFPICPRGFRKRKPFIGSPLPWRPMCARMM